MTPVEIIKTLERRGVALNLLGDNLEISGISKLAESEKSTLRQHKRAFIRVLEKRCDNTASSERAAQFRAFRIAWPGGGCTMLSAPSCTVEEAAEHTRIVFGDECQAAPIETSQEGQS